MQGLSTLLVLTHVDCSAQTDVCVCGPCQSLELYWAEMLYSGDLLLWDYTVGNYIPIDVCWIS